MSILLQKHREETAHYQVDMDSYLEDGEILEGTPTVVVEKHVNGVWESRESEFTVSSISITTSSDGLANAAVKFTMEKAAEADHQAGDNDYRVKVTASTDGGQERVSDNPLVVFD